MKHDGSHGPDCFGCRIKDAHIAPSAMPSRKPHGYDKPRDPATYNHNAWERGIATYEGLPLFMPNSTVPIGQKQAAEKRHVIDEGLHALQAERSSVLQEA